MLNCELISKFLKDTQVRVVRALDEAVDVSVVREAAAYLEEMQQQKVYE